MQADYRIIGAELSPFSVKVRSYFRFKKIPHQWIVRTLSVQQEYGEYFRIPVIPLVVTPDDQSMQDSTPIMEAMEAQHTEHAADPSDPTLKFLSALLEEFGDEWGNKWMFHYRWQRDVDQQSAAGRLAGMMLPEGSDADRAPILQQVLERMPGRVWFVGSNEVTAPIIESNFDAALAQLDAHLAERPYLLGQRPCFGDFGLYCQIYNAWTDPTPGAFIGGRYPNVLAWAQRMLWPTVEGDFEDWSTLQPTLAPFLKDHVGGYFMPWTLANEAAINSEAEEFTVELAGQTWTQKPQKYHAKSLIALREKYAAQGANQALAAILEELGCLEGLSSR
ncbi:MAG: glutathione S-transferase family protein [Halieaceae bacterium]